MKKKLCHVCENELNFDTRFPHRLNCTHIICDLCYQENGENHNCAKEIELNKKISEIIKGRKLSATTSVENEKSRSVSPIKPPNKNDNFDFNTEIAKVYESAISVFKGSKRASKENSMTLGCSGTLKAHHCHCGNSFQAVCITCKVEVCMVCTFLKNHRDHAVIEISELEQIHKKRVDKISSLTKEFTKKLNSSCPKMKIRNLIYKRLAEIKCEIEILSEKLKKSVDNWRNRSYQKVNDFIAGVENLTTSQELDEFEFEEIKKINKKWKEELFDLKHNSDRSKDKIEISTLFKIITKNIRKTVKRPEDLEKMVYSEFSQAEEMLQRIDSQNAKLEKALNRFCRKEFKKSEYPQKVLSMIKNQEESYNFPDTSQLRQLLFQEMHSDETLSKEAFYSGAESNFQETASGRKLFLSKNFGLRNSSEIKSGKEDMDILKDEFQGLIPLSDFDKENQFDKKISPIDFHEQSFDEDDNGTVESVCKSINAQKRKKRDMRIEIEDDSQQNIFLNQFNNQPPLRDFPLQEPKKKNYFKPGFQSMKFEQNNQRNPFTGKKRRKSKGLVQFSLNFSQRSDLSGNNQKINRFITPNAKKSPILFNRQSSQKKNYTCRKSPFKSPTRTKISLKLSLEANRLIKQCSNRNPSDKVFEIYKKIKSSGTFINLRKSKISDKIIAFLFNAFKEIPDGSAVDLSYNKITDVGLDILILSLKHKNLKFLNLSHNLIRGSMLAKIDHILKKTRRLKIQKIIDLKGNDLLLGELDIDIEHLSRQINI